MKEIFKIIVSIALSMVLIFSLSACTQQNDDCYDDEQFQKGIEYGMETMFSMIHNAIGFCNEEILFSGDVWDTDCFSLTLYDKRINNMAYVEYKLILKNTSVSNCAEYGDVFFNAYAIGDIEGMVLSYDDFIYYGVTNNDISVDEYLDGNTIEGQFRLIDNSEFQSLMIIIVTEGKLFSATYDYDSRD